MLKLVPKTPPNPKQAVIERIKRADGALQCPKCAGHDVMTIRNGDHFMGGKRKSGTVVLKDACPHCWKRGIFSDMNPIQSLHVATLNTEGREP